MAAPVSSHCSYLVCGTRFDVECHYRLISPIGQGAYGVVCSAEDTRTGDKVAIKKITKGHTHTHTHSPTTLAPPLPSPPPSPAHPFPLSSLPPPSSLPLPPPPPPPLAFNNLIETKRTLRECQLLRVMKHANIIEILSLMSPVSYDTFDDVYVVSELMSSATCTRSS